MNRRGLMRGLAEVFGFGVVKSASSGASKSAQLTVEAAEDESPSPDCEAWGDAALLSRPVDGAECVYMQAGDERVVIATKDRRWQIELQAGEVVLRAMGAGSPAYVRLKPDGECDIVSNKIRMGAATAGQALVLGNALHTWLAAMTVPTAMGPSGTPINIATFVSSVLSTKHKADS